ncbi:MAG: hypothetical protein WC455_10025 [Dehalococcoidia bacterium]|jgi:hypothetical protein
MLVDDIPLKSFRDEVRAFLFKKHRRRPTEAEIQEVLNRTDGAFKPRPKPTEKAKAKARAKMASKSRKINRRK